MQLGIVKASGQSAVTSKVLLPSSKKLHESRILNDAIGKVFIQLKANAKGAIAMAIACCD